MKFWLICDYRENYTNYANLGTNTMYNDHLSIKNINEILTAINSLGYDCDYFGGIPELINAIDTKRTFENCIFLNFTDGMDQQYSRVQAPALLDILNVPYSGSGVFQSVIMNNKHFCKKALLKLGIDMPKSCVVSHDMPINLKIVEEMHFPLFVKPNCSGSSLGISASCVCHSKDEVLLKTSELLDNFDEVIIEEYVKGIDVTNYLIGNTNSYLVNNIVTAELFDNSPYAIYGIEEKQNKLRKLYLDNEYLPKDIVEKTKKQSVMIAHTLGVHDICRIDYRINLSTQNISFIEINSAPRFSSTSEIGFIASKNNVTFSNMVQYYISTVMDRLK